MTPTSVAWRINAERLMLMAWPRAILLQLAHPLVAAGVEHSTFRSTPFAAAARLHHTVRAMLALTFGGDEARTAALDRIRAIHRRVNGELTHGVGAFAAGTRYSAEDPELLLWILACMADSALVVYQRTVRTLPRDERDAFWQDYKVIGREFGLRDADMPEAIEDFELYMNDMVEGDDLYVTDEARELALEIVMRPPVPLHARPMLEVANFATVGLLPPKVRRMYGFSWDPARALVLRGGAEYAKRVVVPLLPERWRYRRRRRVAA